MNPARTGPVQPRLYLLDVEGTVAPITLVTEQLFPYARAHFSAFLEEYAGDPAVQADLALLAEENRAGTDPDAPRIPFDSNLSPDRHPSPDCHPERAERVEGPAFREQSFLSHDCHPERAERVEGPAFREQSLAYLLWLMDRDRKSTALKSLQGRIWKAGFESGELKGTVFPDVPAALRRWSVHARVAIYSSGSTEAQRLLFRHSICGDLTPLIAGYFDTRTGPKTGSASYAAIAAAMGVESAEVLFFSDVVRELDPAREAGCGTRLVVRPGNAPVHEAHGHAIITSLNEAT